MTDQWTTPWYPGDLKPLPDRIGPFERKYPNGVCMFSPWDGKQWLAGAFRLKDATLHNAFRASEQNLPWRGLKGPK